MSERSTGFATYEQPSVNHEALVAEASEDLGERAVGSLVTDEYGMQFKVVEMAEQAPAPVFEQQDAPEPIFGEQSPVFGEQTPDHPAPMFPAEQAVDYPSPYFPGQNEPAPAAVEQPAVTAIVGQEQPKAPLFRDENGNLMEVVSTDR